MSAVSLVIAGDPPLSPVRIEGTERLGEASSLEIWLEGPGDEDVLPASVLRKLARVDFDTALGRRSVAGIVTRFVVVASDHAHRRAYRMTVAARFALLELRVRCRVFQELSVPRIIEQVVREGGYAHVEMHLGGHYPARRYVVQYQESDAAFVRRLCEDHGLFFRFEASPQGEVFVLDDDSTAAADAYPEGITLVAESASNAPRPIATNVERFLRRAAGKVTLRDYDPERPAFLLEAHATGGLAVEQDLEVYEAPGGFASIEEGSARAKIRLESLRAHAARLSFDTNALGLLPGAGCSLVDDPHAGAGRGAVRAEGRYVVVAVATRWAAPEGLFRATIEVIPRALPFRLPRKTPRPRIAGVQSAWVTGAEGREIHTDRLGRVQLRFHWDIEGARDDRSSLPVRVLQPNLPGPMTLPRVGFEVLVMFEDGDPERPVVIGRSYNAAQPPPLPLPANRAVTSIATDSSPGGRARTAIHMNDAAGREHLLIDAPFSKDKTVARDHAVQTLKNENVRIGADRTDDIGGHERISVRLGYTGGYGSRSVTVGAAQTHDIGGDFVTSVGSEIDLVAGLLIERVGEAGAAGINLGIAHGLGWVGARGGVLGQVAAAALGTARAAYEGYAMGGVEGAAAAAEQSAIGIAASRLPGGEAILAAAKGSSRPMPWDHGRPASGDEMPGGGAAEGGAADGDPAAPGAGHRTVVAGSSYSELVMGGSVVLTPGPVSWVTAGASTTFINGSHTTSAPNVSLRVAGGLGEWLGALVINGGTIERRIAGAMRSTTRGALSVTAGGAVSLSAKSSLTLKVGGDLQLKGEPIVFKCGASEICAASGGVSLKAPTITITGSSRQSGSLTHR